MCDLYCVPNTLTTKNDLVSLMHSLLEFSCTLIIGCFCHRREPSYKPHDPISSTSSFSTSASYTTSSSYKPPPSDTVEDSTVANEAINNDTSNDDLM